jgi:capsular exopolysaccharide synthesis family protein
LEIGRGTPKIHASETVVAPPVPAPGAPGHDDEAAHADAIAQVLRVLGILRRRWLVVAVTTVLACAAAALAITMLQPRWRATATVVLHTTGPQVFDKVKGVTEDAEGRLIGYREYYQTQRTIMHSRAVAEIALAQLGLAADPVFLGIDKIESESEREAAAARVDPIERLRDLVTVQEVRNSRVVEISAEYPDAEVASDIANAIADAYLEHAERGRERQQQDAEGDITAEKETARNKLRLAQDALEAYKKAHQITSISLEDRQSVVTQNILTLSTKAKEAEAERIRIENMFTEAKRLHESGNLAAATLLPEHTRALFERLREDQHEAAKEFETVDTEFGPKAEEHQKAERKLRLVNASIAREGKDLIESLAGQVEAARKTERKIKGSLGTEEHDALARSQLEREYYDLEREAKAAAEDYLVVAKRETEIAITKNVDAEGIEILDRATVPSVPVFPQKLLIIAIAFVIGLGTGSLLAIAIDFRDHRIRGLLDLERALAGFGVPVLGQLPQLPSDTRLGVGNIRAQRRQRDLYAYLFPQSLMAERCRGIRTSLSFAQGGDALRTIMITSPSSSEGKSSTAVNLALSFCQANKRVVIVDADMRRPRIHQVFPIPVEQEGKGLSTLLTEKARLVEVMIEPPEDAPPMLRVLPCGPLPDNPAELLDTPAFRRMLVDLRNHCDLVIIDSPPVLPVTDPVILARQVDGVIMVTRCDSTTRGELQRALSQLGQGDTNVLGVVLNEVDARQERYDYNAAYYTYRAHETETEPA